MASVKGEIDRIATAKANIETAIEDCGVDVPNTALISTYADYVRAIPNAVLSQLNLSEVGGDDKYIKKISQTNGVISASAGGVFTKSGSSASVGLVPKPSTTAGTSKYLREDCSWATPPNYYPKRKFSTGLQITDTSDTTNYAAGALWVPKASASQLGVIRTNYTNNGQNYKVAVNSNGDAYVNVPWVNYYPTTFTWTAGSTSGPTGSLSGEGMTAVSFPAIPSASKDASGVVTTGDQTFTGVKSFSNAVKILNGNDFYLQASSSSTNDSGDVVFANSSGSELMRLCYDSSNATVNNRFCVRFAGGTAYSVQHSGNASVSLSGQTLTVKINGSSKSLTNYYPIRSYTTGLQITTTSDSTNYASGAIYVPYATGSQAGAVSTSTQTFAGSKTFTGAMIVCNTITFGTTSDYSDSYGIRTPVNNYTTIGASGKAFYYAYINNLAPGSNGTGSVGTSSTRYSYGYFSSAVYAASGFYESSDENLKHVLGSVKVDLQKLSKLRKVYYLWKDNPDNGQQLGMIAQDVQKLYPELVDTDEETGLLSLAYDRLSVIALEAIDTLYNEHKVLKERVDKIEKLLKDKEIS